VRGESAKPVLPLQAEKEFHSWILIADWNGSCRCPEKGFFVQTQKTTQTGVCLTFRLETRDRVWRTSRLFHQWNGLLKGINGKNQLELTSIMRVTVEFRFVEHCSSLLNLQLSGRIFIFCYILGQTANSSRLENWMKPNWISVFCRLFNLSQILHFFPPSRVGRCLAFHSNQSFCSRIQFIDIDMIHQ
jgi:hypothetical protein